MKNLATRLLTLAIGLIEVFGASTAYSESDDGFTSLFNGKDLSGWVNVNCAPTTFSVRDGIIVSTGKPTGIIRTERAYENFILELEWRHMVPKGNAGLFVWSDPITARGVPFSKSIEVQVLDGRTNENYTSHGDVFAIHGSKMVPDRPHPNGWMRCLPSEHRCNPAGQWNHYRVTCRNGDLKLAVNGKVVSGAHDCSPRTGYICLESEGSECHFRNIRIKELPPPGVSETWWHAMQRYRQLGGHPLDKAPPPERPWTSLYTGLDLTGWKQDPGHAGHWVPNDWRLRYDGKSEAEERNNKNLWSAKEYTDFELIVDWRFTGKPERKKRAVILPNGDYATNPDGTRKEVEVPDAGDSGVYLRGNSKSQINMWCWPIGSGEVYGYRNDPKQPADVRAGVTPKMNADNPIGQWNRFHITMTGDRLTVVLNEKTVLDNARLPGVPDRGPIALQHHGDPIEFANILIRELD